MICAQVNVTGVGDLLELMLIVLPDEHPERDFEIVCAAPNMTPAEVAATHLHLQLVSGTPFLASFSIISVIMHCAMPALAQRLRLHAVCTRQRGLAVRVICKRPLTHAHTHARTRCCLSTSHFTHAILNLFHLLCARVCASQRRACTIASYFKMNYIITCSPTRSLRLRTKWKAVRSCCHRRHSLASHCLMCRFEPSHQRMLRSQSLSIKPRLHHLLSMASQTAHPLGAPMSLRTRLSS